LKPHARWEMNSSWQKIVLVARGTRWGTKIEHFTLMFRFELTGTPVLLYSIVRIVRIIRIILIKRAKFRASPGYRKLIKRARTQGGGARRRGD
jgi:hypothetical protein